MNTTEIELTSGSVTSADGTRIGYLKTGTGPAAVLLHGSNESARSHLGLARGLADAFTVYLPDRRGRGLSGPHRAGHAMRTEVEDLTAVVAESGAELAFGVSAGGLIVLETARQLPQLRRIALYEPALLVDGQAEAQLRWVNRFDQEMAEDRVSAALITAMFGVELAPPFMKIMPRGLLARLTDKMLVAEDKKAGPDDITMRMLAPTLRYEGLLLAEMTGKAGTYARLTTDVLLMSGSKGLKPLRQGIAQLAKVLPHCTSMEFAGLDHGGSSDVSATNRAGRPELVVPQIRRLFAGR